MTATTHNTVIYTPIHSPTTAIRRLMKLGHMLVEGWQSIGPAFPVHDACTIVTIKGCPKTFQTHPLGLQIWYSSDVMIHTQFVLFLNQFFVRCTVWLYKRFQDCSQGLLRKLAYRLSRLCASCLNVVVTSVSVDSTKTNLQQSFH
jgi:hypothetical protein